MKVDEIFRLPRQPDAVTANPRKKTAAQGTDIPAASVRPETAARSPEASSSEAAVTLTSKLGEMPEEAADPARQARVAQLKEAVTSNTYKPDSTEVAKAVYRELFL